MTASVHRTLSADSAGSSLSVAVDVAAATIRLHGELDATTAEALDVAVSLLAARPTRREVTVSLHHLARIDADGVAALAGLCDQVRRTGATARLVGALPAVARGLRRAGRIEELVAPADAPFAVGSTLTRAQVVRLVARARRRHRPGLTLAQPMALAAHRADLAVRRIERSQAT